MTSYVRIGKVNREFEGNAERQGERTDYCGVSIKALPYIPQNRMRENWKRGKLILNLLRMGLAILLADVMVDH